MAAVALAVGAIPEGLPAAVTITLAIGVARMARRKAIIRKLPAVETLGSTTVICSDKTGTLTENQMTVQEIWAGSKRYEVTGSGYAPEGEIRDADSSMALRQCLIAGVLCNDSQVVEENNRWSIQGDPTEGSLIVAGRKGGVHEAQLQAELPRIDTIPFESHYQYMATIHHSGADKTNLLYVKGAVERVVERCAKQLNAAGGLEEFEPGTVLEMAEKMAKSGLRVLALARGELPQTQRTIRHQDLSGGLTFLGLQAMIDPPRREAIAAMQSCKTAGIQVKMITGDHALTALAVGEKLGLSDDPAALHAVTGKELAEFSEEQLIAAADRSAVFARVAPEQKLRLVQALQRRGHVAAMTGDGVNDAPALKQANIGVAMGITGTDVSKEAADMVLTDDNFATIVSAVEEGRCVFDNLTKFIGWTLPTNMGEGLVILAAIIAGVALPILPVQILWINMTTAVLLGLMLAFEPKEPGIMQRPPRIPESSILTKQLIIRILIVSAVMLAGAFGLFLWHKLKGSDVAVARTVAVNVFVLTEIFYLFQCRSLNRTVWEIGFFSNPWVIAGTSAMIGLQLLFVYLPVMNRLFHSAPVDGYAWLETVAVAAIAYVLIGVEQRFRRKPIRK
jgi:magnesium-transporting ATPase (P-type)